QLAGAGAQPLQLGCEARLVAHQEDLQAALAMCAESALDRGGRSEVAPHGVERDHLVAVIVLWLIFCALLHGLAAVLPALRAGPMREHRLSAVGAGAHVRRGGLPVGPALVALLAAGSLLRD